MTRSETKCRGYYLLSQILLLSSTHGPLLTVWKLRYGRRFTKILCSPPMITLSSLSGAPRWQIRPESSFCVHVYVCVFMRVYGRIRMRCPDLWACVCILPPVWASVLMSPDFISDEQLFECSFGWDLWLGPISVASSTALVFNNRKWTH